MGTDLCLHHTKDEVKHYKRKLSKMVYTKWAGVRLSKRMEEIAVASSTISLRDELTLARALVGDTLRLRAVMEDRLEADGEQGPMLAAISQLSENILDQLKTVQAIAVGAQKVESLYTLDAPTLQAVVLQVAELVDQELRTIHKDSAGAIDVEIIAERLTKRIQHDIVLPDTKPQQIDNVPTSEIASAMDDTVPAFNE